MEKTLRSARQEAFVRLLAEARKKAGLTQIALAERLNDTQGLISRLEGGQRRIDVIEFLLLAEVIGFDPHAMLDRIKEIPRE